MPVMRERHIQRIAFLVVYPNLEPIDIYIFLEICNSDFPWVIEDGNHRVAAALYRGDRFIKANIIGTDDLIRRYFGGSNISL